MGDSLDGLKQRWEASGAFADQELYLKARVAARQAAHVFLDPDGTWGVWLMLVVKAPTGVVYSTQCVGVANEQRFVEGYPIPLGPPGDSSAQLRAVFHRGGRCLQQSGPQLSEQQRAALAERVAGLSVFFSDGLHEDTRCPLRLDGSRMDELAEAWLPVVTPHGPAVLLSDNCD